MPPRDPFTTFNFAIEFDRGCRAAFQEVTGLEVEVLPIEYRSGSEERAIRRIPGVATCRGGRIGRSLWEWCQSEDSAPMSGSITSRTPSERWWFEGARPVSIEAREGGRRRWVGVDVFRFSVEHIERA